MTQPELSASDIKFFESCGGLDAFLERARIFRQAGDLATELRDEPTEQYPNQFAAVGCEGMIAHSPSLRELVKEVQSKGYQSYEYTIKFLDPDPEVWIL